MYPDGLSFELEGVEALLADSESPENHRNAILEAKTGTTVGAALGIHIHLHLFSVRS